MTDTGMATTSTIQLEVSAEASQLRPPSARAKRL